MRYAFGVRTFLLVIAWTGLPFLGACGTSVTTGTGGNASGGGGEGASGASGVVASGPVTTGEVSSSSASGMPTSGTGAGGATLCAQACDRLGMLGCEEPESCTQECEGSYAEDPRCALQLDELAKCISFVQTCDYVAECGQQIDAYIACVDTTRCGPTECASGGTSGGQTSCTCFAVCHGLDVTSDCTSADGLEAKCQCLVSGMTVGGCTQPADLSCELELGCCSQFF